EVIVTFDKAVTGIDATDLLINGAPAAAVSGGPSVYTFTYPQPPLGTVAISWAANHAIKDLAMPPDDFDATRPSSTWNYALVDLTPPIIANIQPPASATVTNLTQITITFSEPVSGVDARDLRINGAPASALFGGPTTYTFS